MRKIALCHCPAAPACLLAWALEINQATEAELDNLRGSGTGVHAPHPG